MKDITPLLKKGQKIWFVDAEFRNGHKVYFAEYGTFIKFKNNECVIHTYFTYDDNFTLPVEKIYLSKESCEQAIYIAQTTKKLDIKENPTSVKITKIKKAGKK